MKINAGNQFRVKVRDVSRFQKEEHTKYCGFVCVADEVGGSGSAKFRQFAMFCGKRVAAGCWPTSLPVRQSECNAVLHHCNTDCSPLTIYCLQRNICLSARFDFFTRSNICNRLVSKQPDKGFLWFKSVDTHPMKKL